MSVGRGSRALGLQSGEGARQREQISALQRALPWPLFPSPGLCVSVQCSSNNPSCEDCSDWPWAIASAVGLVAWESRHREPLLDPRFFRRLPFAAATLVAVLAFVSFSGFLFLNSLYLQEARGMTASQAGLATLPIALALMLCSPLSGRLVGAGHARLSLVIAGGAMAAGALLLTALARDTPLAYLLAAYGIFGVGLGMVNAPITNTAVSGMPRSRAAIASAVASTSRQVGASLGVALAGSLAGAGIESAYQPGFAAATHAFFWVSAGLGLAIVALGLASTGSRARASAARVACLFDGARPDRPT